MVIILWQGIISIHQKSFLEALSRLHEVDKVMLVVENDITPYRKNMGWSVPEIIGVELVLAPSHEKIKKIFEENIDATHVFGGIKVGKILSVAFQEAINRKARIGILSEPFNKSGIKGYFRKIKYMFQKIQYARHIDFFLAVGKAGVATFRDLGYSPSKIFPWAYFVSIKIPEVPKQLLNSTTKIVYAGRIENAKGILGFVKELAAFKDENFRLDIYGNGSEEAALKDFVKDKGLSDKICVYPFLKYDELLEKYAFYDWVVLPSTQKDGWGVIVSEGLLNGLKAICSNICGVSWVIKDNFNGVVFDWAEKESCSHAIRKMINGKDFADRNAIKSWAEQMVSAGAGARYFIDIVNCVYHNNKRPVQPWGD